MEYLKINLENYGGFDVEFELSKNEFNARVKADADFRKQYAKKFNRQYQKSFNYVHSNIISFPSIDVCDGPMWDIFREALVDLICKTYMMTYVREEQVVA